MGQHMQDRGFLPEGALGPHGPYSASWAIEQLGKLFRSHWADFIFTIRQPQGQWTDFQQDLGPQIFAGKCRRVTDPHRLRVGAPSFCLSLNIHYGAHIPDQGTQFRH
jgi:hypothetical protein